MVKALVFGPEIHQRLGVRVLPRSNYVSFYLVLFIEVLVLAEETARGVFLLEDGAGLYTLAPVETVNTKNEQIMFLLLQVSFSAGYKFLE